MFWVSLSIQGSWNDGLECLRLEEKKIQRGFEGSS